jgi:hypothetical protein
VETSDYDEVTAWCNLFLLFKIPQISDNIFAANFFAGEMQYVSDISTLCFLHSFEVQCDILFFAKDYNVCLNMFSFCSLNLFIRISSLATNFTSVI